MLDNPDDGLPLELGDVPTVRRQRTSVANVQPLDESDSAPLKPVDYTFRRRHIEMIAIGNFAPSQS